MARQAPAPKVNPQVAARIRARESEALAAGWSWELLWGNRFWVIGTDGRNRPGLAALLKPGDEIGAVTDKYIEIVKQSGVTHRFYNPDRKQPWIVTAGA